MNQFYSGMAVVVLGVATFFSPTPAFADYGDFNQVRDAILKLNRQAAQANVPAGEAIAGKITLPYLVAVRTDPQPNGTKIGDVVPQSLVRVKQTMVVAGIAWYLIEWNPNSGVVQWPANAQPAVLYGATPSAGWVHSKALTVTHVQGAPVAQPAAAAPVTPAAPAPIYDVYYLSADGRKWEWYAGYHNGADVDSVIKSAQAQGYQATWVKR